MTDTKEQEYQAFIAFHGPQLKAMGLPETLHRRIFAKLKFNDFDFGERVQMIIDEDDDQMYLRTIKDLNAAEDVYLVDHAWTFKHRTAMKDLRSNEKLVERLENIMKYPQKKDLPGENPYAKKRPSLEEYLKTVKESAEPVLEYDLDEYDIEELKTIEFRPEVEQVSLFDNKVHNPKDITEILMKMPNLRALWLNGNPV